jgi:hypothetical protein
LKKTGIRYEIVLVPSLFGPASGPATTRNEKAVKPLKTNNLAKLLIQRNQQFQWLTACGAKRFASPCETFAQLWVGSKRGGPTLLARGLAQLAAGLKLTARKSCAKEQLKHGNH